MLLYKNTILLVSILLLSCKESFRKDSLVTEGVLASKVLADKLTYPWEITWGPDNFIWMTERDGRISRVNPTNGVVTPLLVVPGVIPRGEGGLLGMALHPDFNNNHYIFVAYDYEEGSTYEAKIVRFTYANNTLTNEKILLSSINAGNIHNGCRLMISPDNKLFITTGDAGNTSSPQNTNALNGKLLRINLDGTIPGDNPFPNNPVWSFGHRNPQGLVFANNLLYNSEHGPDSDDEINIIEKGRNYGWPDVKGFCDAEEQSFCAAHNVRQPIKAWTPTIATCGLDYYDNNLIPEWKNSLLLCTLKGSALYQLQLDNNKTGITSTKEFFASKYGRLRDICISPDGKVYVCTSNGNNDVIIEITKQKQ